MNKTEKLKFLINCNNGTGQLQESFDATITECDSVGKEITEAAGEQTYLMPQIECIHAGLTKNYTFYSSEELQGNPAEKTGIYSWTDPYCKPMLKNHDTRSEPLGRIQSARFITSGLKGANAVVIQPKLLDKEAIGKVQNGLYQTVSIGCSAKELICSICGTDNIRDWCEHWPGDEYDGQVCNFIVKGITFNECSFVNVPADDKAMVIDPGTTQTNSEGANEDTSKNDPKEIDAAANDVQESVTNQDHDDNPPQEEAPPQEENPPKEEQSEEAPPAEEAPSEEAPAEEDPLAQEDTRDTEIEALKSEITQLKSSQQASDAMIVQQVAEAKRSFASAIIQLKSFLGHPCESSDTERQRLESRQFSSLIDNFDDLIREAVVAQENPAKIVRQPQVVDNTANGVANGETNKKDVVSKESPAAEEKKAPTTSQQLLKRLSGK